MAPSSTRSVCLAVAQPHPDRPRSGGTINDACAPDTTLPGHRVDFTTLRKGGYDAKARIADMDLDGVEAEILYPTAGLRYEGILSDGGFAYANASKAFVASGAELVKLLQGELGGDWVVEFMPEPVAPPGLRLRPQVAGRSWSTGCELASRLDAS